MTFEEWMLYETKRPNLYDLMVDLIPPSPLHKPLVMKSEMLDEGALRFRPGDVYLHPDKGHNFHVGDP